MNLTLERDGREILKTEDSELFDAAWAAALATAPPETELTCKDGARTLAIVRTKGEPSSNPCSTLETNAAKRLGYRDGAEAEARRSAETSHARAVADAHEIK